MLSKMLAVFVLALPLIGITGVVVAIYGTISINGYDADIFYHRYISDLGRSDTISSYLYTHDNDNVFFKVGFTIASDCIICGIILKVYLMKQIWKISCLLLFNAIALITGAILLIVMACTPYNINNDRHSVCAMSGMFIIVLTQISDAVYWIKYMKYRQINSTYKFYLLNLYSFLCPMLALIFYGLWVRTEQYAYTPQWYVEGEWIGVLFCCLGFIIQTVHAVFIYLDLTQIHVLEPSGGFAELATTIQTTNNISHETNNIT
eukprot:129987_1